MSRAQNIPAIRIKGLSKKYFIGKTGRRRDTFREMLMSALLAPIRKFNGYRSGPGEGREFWALKGINLEVQPGEVIGVIGRNGAGKSTLLKIVSRITAPTTGRIEIRGRVSSLLEVGTGFHPELTGRENIFLNGAILGMSRQEVRSKFDQIVAFAEVEEFLDTPVKRYSSGMYVRLAFAVAAHLESEILLVDEVLAVGDFEFQKRCLGKMSEVAKRGRTVLFVSHNMVAVRNLCSRAILLQSGKIIESDSADSVISRYISEQAAKQGAVIDLPPSHDKAVIGQAICLCFYDHAHRPTSYVRIRDSWFISLKFEILKPLSNVVAAVGISTIESVPVITYWSREKDLEPGTYRVEFECNVPLRSNDLTFAVGLSRNGATFYYENNIGRISISEVATRDQPFRSSGSTLLWSTQSSEIQRV